jgi:hypothetical protein
MLLGKTRVNFLFVDNIFIFESFSQIINEHISTRCSQHDHFHIAVYGKMSNIRARNAQL